jgi:hypothetical protein
MEIPNRVSSEYCYSASGALLYVHRYSFMDGNTTNLTLEAIGAPEPASDADFVLPAAPTSAQMTGGETILPTDSGPEPMQSADAKTELANLLELQAKSAWKVGYGAFNDPQNEYNWSHDGKGNWLLSQTISGDVYKSYVLDGQYYVCGDTTGDWICRKTSIMSLGPDYGLLDELKSNTMIDVKKVDDKKVMGSIQTACFKLRFTTYAGTYCYYPKNGVNLYSNTSVVREATLYMNIAPARDFELPTSRIVNETAGGFGS